MELSAATVFLSVVSPVILASLLSRRSSASSKKKRPPGPWCLPLIGNLLHLLTSQPQAALRDLARKHGPVMSLRLGQVDAVVISSPAAAQEVLRDKDLTFASRPRLLAADIILYGNMDIAFAPYGAYWRMLRKLCMIELLSTHKVRQLAPVRDGETRSLVRKVGAAGRGGEPDMLTGGTETTSSASEWIMSELMRNPEAMAKAQAEVRRTLDGKRPEDHEGLIGKLRYMKMVIKEGLRLNPVLPLLLPRLCGETCEIGGFQVAKGTKVIVNAWAMARSPEHWPDAEEFRPERFDGGAARDFKGLQFEYLPFGSGRRMCPGDTFGLAVLELIVARLLYYFDWNLPNGMRPDELDMDMIVGSTARRKNQLHLLASPSRELPVEI